VRQVGCARPRFLDLPIAFIEKNVDLVREVESTESSAKSPLARTNRFEFSCIVASG
jgi:hypothetical protein